MTPGRGPDTAPPLASDYEFGVWSSNLLRARQYYQRLTAIDELPYTSLGAQLGAHNERLAPATAYPPITSATTLGNSGFISPRLIAHEQ